MPAPVKNADDAPHKYWVQFMCEIYERPPTPDVEPVLIAQYVDVICIGRDNPIGNFAEVFGMQGFIAKATEQQRKLVQGSVRVKVMTWTKLEKSLIVVPDTKMFHVNGLTRQ